MENDKLDEIDIKILNALQDNSEISFESLGKELGVSKSTIHYRVMNLNEKGIIKKFSAIVDPEKVGMGILAVSLIRAHYNPGYVEYIGDKLKNIQGVWGVYFLIGEHDFVVLIRAKDKEDLNRIVETFTSMKEIERSNTHVIIKKIKEDIRVDI
jgi:DNA-binding Lrp family transcriptional regulator